MLTNIDYKYLGNCIFWEIQAICRSNNLFLVWLTKALISRLGVSFHIAFTSSHVAFVGWYERVSSEIDHLNKIWELKANDKMMTHQKKIYCLPNPTRLKLNKHEWKRKERGVYENKSYSENHDNCWNGKSSCHTIPCTVAITCSELFIHLWNERAQTTHKQNGNLLENNGKISRI